MTRLSFAVVILVFFNPITNLWERIINSQVAVSLSLFGFQIQTDIPYVGISLLLLYCFGSWLILTLALTGLEKYLGKDFLEVLHLRNGMLNASQPTLIAWPYLAARFLFFFILAKYFVELILQIVLLTNRSSIPGVFLTNVFGSANYEITIRSIMSWLRGPDRSQQAQLMLVSVSFLYVVLNRFFFFEKDRRHYRDLRARQAMRRSTEKK